jgi:hypothetical protein
MDVNHTCWVNTQLAPKYAAATEAAATVPSTTCGVGVNLWVVIDRPRPTQLTA